MEATFSAVPRVTGTSKKALVIQMNKSQVIEKAIQKAIDGGWNRPYTVSIRAVPATEDEPKITYKKTMDDWETYAPIIFNHEFCKALWGDMSYAELKGAAFSSANIVREPKAWEHHLQQMVICSDPIEYLGEHLDD